MEEDAIEMYAQHVAVAVRWSGFPEATQAKIKKSLDALAKDSHKRGETLKELMAKVEKEEKDVY
jgi:hypothetical protein